MNGKNIHDAVEYVGWDLVDMAEKQRFPHPHRKIWTAAAALAVLIGLGAAAMYLQKPPAAAPMPMQEAPVTETPPIQEDIADPMLPVQAEVPEERETHPLQKLFPCLDAETLPAAAGDWDTFYLNETGADAAGSGICTLQGDPVLAIDAKNGILLIRVQGEDYRGVLAIAKDPQRLSQQASSQIGTSGETVGAIAEAHNGVLAINGSRPLSDEEGSITDGMMAGYAMCNGVSYQADAHLEGAVRLEIDGEGRFRLTDTQLPVSDDTLHAVETPFAVIRDGVIVVDENLTGGLLPRACIGQTAEGEILMLVVEGRRPDEGVVGIALSGCAAILERYGCENALQLDTGTSAILWFDGTCVTRCSNPWLPEGRLLPTAFVVERVGD